MAAAKKTRKCPDCGEELPAPKKGQGLRCVAHVTEGTREKPLVTEDHPEGLIAHRRPCGWKEA